jgi:hypothetical protein
MVSAMPMQSATLHRFHSTTTGLHPDDLPLGYLNYSDRPSTEADEHPFIQTGLGAWDLTPSARPAFAF